MFRFVLVVSLLLNFLLGIFLVTKPSTPIAADPTVTRVLDGDTIELSTHQIIRLINIDAPELTNCAGEQSKKYLEDLVLNKPVRVVGDQLDARTRLLGLVYQGHNLVNLDMVSSGWARFKSQKTTESARIQTAFTQAKTDKKGLFSLCIQNSPPNPACAIKGNVREGEKSYSFPGCGSYNNVILELDQGDAWFCTEDEAVSAGFTKAANCHDKSYQP